MATELGEMLRVTIDREYPALGRIGESDAAQRDGNGWTRKEELGHLLDSAVNNHIRFVRGTLETAFEGPSYDGDGWVRLHAYNELPWSTLIDLWQRHNLMLAHLVAQIPEERLDTRCVVASKAVTLGFLIEDYILHMQHHLDHILGRETLTNYPGAAIGV